jgi:multicomponent Na+:H+ antiporter subunit A
MRPSLIIDLIVRICFHSVLVLAAYLLFAGHNQPGGGFIAGLVAGGAFGLRYGSGGIDAVRAGMRVSPWTLVGAGLVLAAGTALIPIALGHAPLDHAKVDLALGPLGEPKVTSALPFDTGVFLVVVGMVLMVFEAFGETLPEPTAEEREVEPEDAR